MLIFDKFITEKDAAKFCRYIERKFPPLKTFICVSHFSSDALDVFPYYLRPPIVLVERPNEINGIDETIVAAAVKKYGGVFAGT